MGQLKNKHTSNCKFFISPLQKNYFVDYLVWLRSHGDQWYCHLLEQWGWEQGSHEVELIHALIRFSAAEKINFGASGLGGREGPSRSHGPN